MRRVPSRGVAGDQEAHRRGRRRGRLGLGHIGAVLRHDKGGASVRERRRARARPSCGVSGSHRRTPRLARARQHRKQQGRAHDLRNECQEGAYLCAFPGERRTDRLSRTRSSSKKLAHNTLLQTVRCICPWRRTRGAVPRTARGGSFASRRLLILLSDPAADLLTARRRAAGERDAVGR